MDSCRLDIHKLPFCINQSCHELNEIFWDFLLFSSKIDDRLILIASDLSLLKLGNMLMTPKNDNESKKKKKLKKGESGATEEEEAVRLLSEEPLDWMLKNEKVVSMLSVS